LNRKEILIIIVAATLAYLPFLAKGVTNDDFVFLDYAARLTKNPTVCQVGDYRYQGVLLEDLIVFESTHPPLVPYVIRLTTHFFGDNLIALHLAFLPFTLLASLALGYLVRRTSGHHPALALAVTLGPLFLANATSLMTDAPLFAFWFAAMACLDHALAGERSHSAAHWAAWLMALCAFFTSYQGLGLLAVFPCLGLAHGKLRQAMIWVVAALAPFLLWLLLVWWRYRIFPYFATPHANVSIASEVTTGLLLANIWVKARVILIYAGAGLGLFLAWSMRTKSPWLWAAAAGWGLAMAAFLAGSEDVGALLQTALFAALGVPALVVSGTAIGRLWRSRGHERWIEAALVCCAAGFALFQIAFAAFAAPRYILILLAAMFLLLLRQESPPAGKSPWILAAVTVLLGLGVARADWEYARAQRLERLPLPADVSIAFVGEQGMKVSGEKLGYHYFLPEDQYDIGYLLVPVEIDHLAVPSALLQERAEEMQRFTLNSALPIRVMNQRANAGFYRHTQGLLPFAFNVEPIETFVLYRCYQPGNPDWQARAYRPVPAGHILPDAPVTQDFICARDGLTRIELLLATGARRNQSTLVVSLSELDGEAAAEIPVQRWELAAETLQDNSWHQFDFPAQRSLNKRYRLTLSSPDATPSSAMTIWTNSNATGTFRRAETPIQGALGLKALCLPATTPPSPDSEASAPL